MPSTISSDCPQVRASQAVRSRESFWRGRLDCVSGLVGFSRERRVSLMLITMLVAAVGRKPDAPTAPLRRVGIRPRFSARSSRQPRRILHCSCVAPVAWAWLAPYDLEEKGEHVRAP